MDIYEDLGCFKIGCAAGQKLHKVKDGETFGDDFCVSIKEDGVSGILVYNKGELRMFSLSGKPLSNTAALLSGTRDNVPLEEGRVYFGEIVDATGLRSLEQLSGTLNPNAKEVSTAPPMDFRVFDTVTVDEYVKGESCTPWEQRQSNIPESVRVLQSRGNMAEMLWQSVKERDAEGIVFARKSSPWLRGKRVRHLLKKVVEPRFDLKILDVEEGKGKREGMTGRLVLDFKGNRINADLGAGFDDKARRVMLYHKNTYIGQVATVKCLRVSSTGTNLRLAKVVEIRFDTLEEASK